MSATAKSLDLVRLLVLAARIKAERVEWGNVWSFDGWQAALLFAGNDHMIELNDFHHVTSVGYDSGKSDRTFPG
jgi:hypothetical protein